MFTDGTPARSRTGHKRAMVILLILSILVAISAALTIHAIYHGPPRNEYLFKPTTTGLIILIALLGTDPPSTTYHVLIVIGLVASLAGDVFLMLPSDKFIYGLASFLIAQILYAIAFTVEGDATAPIWYVIPFVIYGVLMLRLLWPHLGPVKIPVIIYMAAILIMAWQAANRWIETEHTHSLIDWLGDSVDNGTLLAMLGAYLFVASDSILALDRFRQKFHTARLWTLSTYFVAQWLIALSV